MNFLKRLLIIFFKKSEALSALSCRLAKITGKSRFAVHPKHLIKEKKPWYLKYVNKKHIVLDVGCGHGEHSLKIAQHCKKTTAFDINEKALKQAREKQRQAGINNIEFLKINANNNLPFKNNSFDLVLCQDVLEHVKDYKKTTKEVLRVLKKNGLLLLTLPNMETGWKKLKKAAGLPFFADKNHVREWSLKEIDNFPKEFSLTLLARKPIVYDTPLTGFIDLIGGISLSLYQRFLRWKENQGQKHPEESTGFSLVLKKN